MTVWFTSDSHYGHESIIRHSARPYENAAEMDATLTANWNAVVRPRDTIWHLGDFAFRNSRPAGDYLAKLNGEKHLIWGNHDGDETRTLKGWASSQAYAEITVDGVRIVLLHYAMRVWHRSHKGSLHLFGHSHNTLSGDSRSCDVGVDNPAWAYRPVALPEIMAFLETQPERVETAEVE